ncbi:hypothetical protein [Subtercola frigoramans]|uniref:Uncharacterized protein n=1 Tax=Subtercola frigoramans TaxID=120298 RepID=A0ABS2L641_9MICO|nr:hypothetical protein [Subtercola frigoramans]MBM7472494.1 hypothetical protein [Subtercola frigoramans]
MTNSNLQLRQSSSSKHKAHGQAAAPVLKILTSLTLLAGLAGCSSATTGILADDQKILDGCPKGQQLASIIEIDGTSSGRSTTSDTERLSIVQEITTRTVICGGHLTISAFSSSSGSTSTIFDGDVSVAGETDIAKLRRVPDAVDQVMTEVKANYGKSLAELPEDGSDIIGIYRVAAEQKLQLGDHYKMAETILTDGEQNVGGINLDTDVLTKDTAVELARSIPMPQLPDVDITVAGIGRVAGDPLPSSKIEALIDFYDALCAQTGASSCLSVTDWK